MDNEIEYLSEDEIAQASASMLQLFYVYFNEHGAIDAITNEKKSNTILNFIEVEYNRVEKFLTGKSNFLDYVVSLVDKDTPVIVKKTEDAGANTNLLISIEPQLAPSTLNVVWDMPKKSWSCYIEDTVKSQFKDLGLSTRLLFFVTHKSNSNFLVNTFSIDMKELIASNSIEIPWNSKVEENIDNISITTKRFFDSYGLLINE